MENPTRENAQATGTQWKFIIAGLLILTAVAYLIFSSTRSSAHYFLTVSEVEQCSKDLTGQDVRISGAVLGETVQYDPDNLLLHFTVVHIPADMQEVNRMGGIAAVLHDATLDANLPRLQVVYHGVRPDMLRNEAQAIMTGKIGEDGIFQAQELLLKCPTRYEDAVPEQIE